MVKVLSVTAQLMLMLSIILHYRHNSIHDSRLKYSDNNDLREHKSDVGDCHLNIISSLIVGLIT